MFHCHFQYLSERKIRKPHTQPPSSTSQGGLPASGFTWVPGPRQSSETAKAWKLRKFTNPAQCQTTVLFFSTFFWVVGSTWLLFFFQMIATIQVHSHIESTWIYCCLWLMRTQMLFQSKCHNHLTQDFYICCRHAVICEVFGRFLSSTLRKKPAKPNHQKNKAQLQRCALISVFRTLVVLKRTRVQLVIKWKKRLLITLLQSGFCSVVGC